MRELPRRAHAPSCPAVHAPLGASHGSGGCRPPPPVAAPVASSLRAPSRGDPPRCVLSASDGITTRGWLVITQVVITQVDVT